MKIIRQGKSKEEIEKLLKQTKRFACTLCDCIFEADLGEYKYEEEYIYTSYYCECPNCGRIAYEARLTPDCNGR